MENHLDQAQERETKCRDTYLTSTSACQASHNAICMERASAQKEQLHGKRICASRRWRYRATGN